MEDEGGFGHFVVLVFVAEQLTDGILVAGTASAWVLTYVEGVVTGRELGIDS